MVKIRTRKCDECGSWFEPDPFEIGEKRYLCGHCKEDIEAEQEDELDKWDED